MEANAHALRWAIPARPLTRTFRKKASSWSVIAALFLASYQMTLNSIEAAHQLNAQRIVDAALATAPVQNVLIILKQDIPQGFQPGGGPTFYFVRYELFGVPGLPEYVELRDTAPKDWKLFVLVNPNKLKKRLARCGPEFDVNPFASWCLQGTVPIRRSNADISFGNDSGAASGWRLGWAIVRTGLLIGIMIIFPLFIAIALTSYLISTMFGETKLSSPEPPKLKPQSPPITADFDEDD